MLGLCSFWLRLQWQCTWPQNVAKPAGLSWSGPLLTSLPLWRWLPVRTGHVHEAAASSHRHVLVLVWVVLERQQLVLLLFIVRVLRAVCQCKQVIVMLRWLP